MSVDSRNDDVDFAKFVDANRLEPVRVKSVHIDPENVKNLDKPHSEGNLDRLTERRRSSAPKFEAITAMTYTWHNINAWGKNQDSLFKYFKRRPKENKHILKSVTGVARPGELLAIMGASGAGKTTLLNILTCRNTGNLKLTGDRKVNGYPMDKNTLSSISAYIQQTDIFMGTLTPREHLIFQATLRMERTIPQKERLNKVEEVIQEMGLSKCADTIIGIPGRIKGLSGGQKKRLSIATEVLSDPLILFCDEPTTGLDSFMTQSIVKSLKTLAARGKTIICTIHQPASGTYAQFDRLLLMSEGRTAFLGDCSDALIYFNDIGYPVPLEYNPADFFVFTLAIRQGSEDECLKKDSEICDKFEDSDYFVDVKDAIQQENRKSWQMLSIRAKALEMSPYKATWLSQYKACTWRATKIVLKDPLVLKVQLAQSFFVALLIGSIYWANYKTKEGYVQNTNGFIYISIAYLTLSSIFPVANVFWNELPVFMREHYNGTYRIHSYYLAKTTAELPVYFFIPILFVTISYWMSGLNTDLDRFFIAIAISILITNIGSSLGLMISVIAPSLEATLAITSAVIMPFFIFGGFLLNKESIQIGFIWLKYSSWFLYANEALSVNQWVGVKDISCKVNGTHTCFRTGEENLKDLSFKQENFLPSIGALIFIFFCVKSFAYFGLLAKTCRHN